MSEPPGSLTLHTLHDTLLSRNDRDRSDHRRWVSHASVRTDDDSLPDVEERNLNATIEKLLAVVPAEGGSVENIDIWGRRRMAYEIAKKAEGIYAVINFTATPATTKELERQLGLNESILRIKVLRVDA